MPVRLTLEIKLWNPGEQERIFTGDDLIANWATLNSDKQLLQAIMLDNFRMVLSVDGKVVSRCAFMYDGESSPDLMYLYEQHLPALYQGQSVTIEFFEEMTAWRLIPENKEDMKWEVIDNSAGLDSINVENEGVCKRLPFVTAAMDWLAKAIEVMEKYKENKKAAGGEDLTSQIEYAHRLLDFSRKTLSGVGWR
ncbi:MAG: hypothetical protein JNN15_06790 [Blastocatellia bacterium]|nr:hypothetical protein [Blastocatellia bacterium]